MGWIWGSASLLRGHLSPATFSCTLDRFWKGDPGPTMAQTPFTEPWVCFWLLGLCLRFSQVPVPRAMVRMFLTSIPFPPPSLSCASFPGWAGLNPAPSHLAFLCPLPQQLTCPWAPFPKVEAGMGRGDRSQQEESPGAPLKVTGASECPIHSNHVTLLFNPP